MTWNYRVMRHDATADADAYYAVHEVYYGDEDDKGRLSWTSEPTHKPFGETVEELVTDLRHIIAALGKPVLDFDTGREIEPPAQAVDLGALAKLVSIGR